MNRNLACLSYATCLALFTLTSNFPCEAYYCEGQDEEEVVRETLLLIALKDVIDRTRQDNERAFIANGFDRKTESWKAIKKNTLCRLSKSHSDCYTVEELKPNFNANTDNLPTEGTVFSAVLKKFDKESGIAELSVFRYKGKLDANGYVLVLQLKNGEWKVRKRTSHWIS